MLGWLLLFFDRRTREFTISEMARYPEGTVKKRGNANRDRLR